MPYYIAPNESSKTLLLRADPENSNSEMDKLERAAGLAAFINSCGIPDIYKNYKVAGVSKKYVEEINNATGWDLKAE